MNILFATVLSLSIGQTGYDTKSLPGTICTPRNTAQWADFSLFDASSAVKGLKNITTGDRFSTCPVLRDRLNAKLYDFLLRYSGNTFNQLVTCLLWSCDDVGFCTSSALPGKSSATTSGLLYWTAAEIPSFAFSYLVECKLPRGTMISGIAWTEDGVTD